MKSALNRRGFLAASSAALLGGLAGCGAQGTASTSPATAGSAAQSGATLELLNVSYDPTRELWKDLNAQFLSSYLPTAPQPVTISQSHGGSSSQARAVIDGLEADVVTLALWSDTQAIAEKGLIKEGWEKKFPHNALPYTSTIVFVVRKGNPKKIKDWTDLVQSGVEVITPNPKTSGNGKLSFLAAWGAVLLNGGTLESAQAFVTDLYKHVPVLDTGARGATTTFAQKQIGDVHLTWENEAQLEVQESDGSLEIVYPQRSIQAEPPVAVVDANVDRRGTRAAAEAYLNFLYTPAGQTTIAKHFYRPTDPAVLKEQAQNFPAIELFPITKVADSWQAAQDKFFAEGGLFDQIYQPTSG